MKKHYHSVTILLLTLLLTGIISGCAVAPVLFETIAVYGGGEIDEKQITVENEYLRMEFDCETTSFALTDKTSGRTWYSNPPDAEDDEMAITTIKERLQAQIVLVYGQIGGTITEVNNYTLSVKNDTYEYEVLDNGIKVMYTIGKVEKIHIVPHAMTETRIMEFYDLMNDEQQGMINNYFRILNIERLRPTDNKEELLEMYPELENERIFELRDELPGHIMERLETAFEDVGYTMEDFIADSRDSEGLESEAPVFNISVIYTLDGPDFVVTVPQEEIEFRHAYPVLSVAVLPYFGAAGQDDDGFMLVPDASGAIIYNNNEKYNQSQFTINLYGYDYALKRTAVISENFAYMPVFGAANGDESFICVIEEGDTNAAVEADVSGRTNTYNNVNARYTVINWDDVDISKAGVLAKVFDRGELTGQLRQRYMFINANDYASMAACYRDYLLRSYPSLTRHGETNLPVVLELVGAINKTENKFGVPVEKPYALTTYRQASDIIERFAGAGIPGLRVNYTGWFNDGVLHKAPGKISLISELGRKRDFNDLINTAKNTGTELFFESDFTFIHNDGLFDGFNINRDSVKRLDREVAQIYPYCFVCFNEWSGRYGSRYSHHLANFNYTSGTIDSFYDELLKLGGENITFASIGRSLNSDFNVKKPASRRDVMLGQVEKLSGLRSEGAKLMIHGGNMFAAPYADIIIDTATEANYHNLIDESVPFYQMVLHGLVPFTGTPVNLAADYERSILKAVESGAGLYFVFMQAPGEDLLETNYTRYFASDITRWGNEPIELYHKLNNELSHTAGLFITDHKILAPSVTLTGYEDGTQVIVNYTNNAFEYGGIVINGMDFGVIRS